MPFDADGNLWETIAEYEADRWVMPTQEEIDETTAEMEAWEQTPEGKAFAIEEEARQVERRARAADPNRLTNRHDVKDFPLFFAQAVQAIWDETGKPCRLREAGNRAGMDADEYIMAAAFARNSGLVRMPIRDGMVCMTLFEPGVG